ncbi:MAG: DNA replication and repair protein RecF [Acidobacteriota bacterium]
MLARLEARSFRNLADLDLALSPGSHLFLGPNGAGKSSILEAVYYLATSRSFRARQIADCVRHGAAGFSLVGEVEGDARLRLAAGFTEGKKFRSVNGRTTSLADHLAALPVVSWATGDAEILTGSPQFRRRLLDRGILGLRPTSLEALERFRRALLQKREILQRGDGPIGEELPSWNGVLAGAIAELAELRNAFFLRLRDQLAGVLADLDLPIPQIEINYRPSPSSALDGAEEIFRSLGRLADREIRRGGPLVGSQRDEIEIGWGGRDIRSVASAGERKVLGLAILAAHAKVLSEAGRAPLVLLDDADAELATATLAAVWKTFASAPQILTTSSRPQAWLTVPVDQVWGVEKGVLSAL